MNIKVLILIALCFACEARDSAKTQTTINSVRPLVPEGSTNPASQEDRVNPTVAPAATTSSPSFVFSAPDNGIDLRSYFPTKYTVILSRHADGSLYSDYRFYESLPGVFDSFLGLYNSLFNLQKPGRLLVWEKRYKENHDSCIVTYAHLFKGDDKSVSEVGDWSATDGCHPDVAIGYSAGSAQNPDGLAWSAPGGLDTPSSFQKNRLAYKDNLGMSWQSAPGTAFEYFGNYYRAWNETVVVETLPTFKPAYGRSSDGKWGRGLGKTYSNVVRLIFYHGTVSKADSFKEIHCHGKLDRRWEFSRFYKHHSGYQTYASEIYLAPGKGIIQEALLYTESGAYWRISDCTGLALDSDHDPARSRWVSYIDEK